MRMKYWMFQHNQVVGPYDREELSEQGGFSAESLVCPEGRKGTQMGDWQRAGVVAELAEVLLRKARVPAGSYSSFIEPGASLIPPEPTLRDLAVLGTLQEKVSLLENSLTQLQDELRQREEEITGLKVHLDEKTQESAQLKDKLTGLETRIEATEGGLKEEIGRTKDELSQETELIGELKGQLDSVRSDIQDSLSKLEENQGRLRDELKEEMIGLRKAGPATPVFASSAPTPGLEDAGDLPAAAGAGDLGELPPPPGLAGSLEEVPPPSLEIPEGDDAPLPMPEMSFEESDLPPPSDLQPPPGDLPPPPGMEMPGAEDTFDGPGGLEFPDDAPAVTLEPPPSLDAPVPGIDIPNTAPGMVSEPLVPPPTLPAPSPDFGAGDADLVDLSAAGAAQTAATKTKSGFFRKLMIFTVFMTLVAGAAFQGYQMGILKPYLDPMLKPILPVVKPLIKPYLQRLGLLPTKGSPIATLKETPEETSAAPEEMPDRTQEAIDFAKNYPVGASGRTLAQILEDRKGSARLLEPWNAERLAPSRFQVNFYGKPGSAPDFQFEVMLDEGQIRGLTAKSIQALNGELPAAAKPPAAPKPKARSTRRGGGASRRRRSAPPRSELADDGSLNDPLGQMLLDSSLGERAPIKKAPAPEAEEEAPPEPAKPARLSRRQRRAAEKAAAAAASEPAEEEDDSSGGQSEDELTLDELLLPGVPRQ